MITSLQMSEKIIATMANKIGRDIKLLKMPDKNILADYFVICTTNSSNQIKNLCDEVEKVMEEAGEPLINREGYRAGGWVLLDFGAVVAHVFLEEARRFYGLEHLWSDAEDIDISEIVGER